MEEDLLMDILNYYKSCILTRFNPEYSHFKFN
jgi:hypothetical protein